MTEALATPPRQNTPMTQSETEFYLKNSTIADKAYYHEPGGQGLGLCGVEAAGSSVMVPSSQK